MSTSGKIALSLGFVSSALLAAWLLTGDRKGKTSAFVAKKAASFKSALKAGKFAVDDQMACYI
ncbi:MAG: hypothetical protein OEV74_06375 [Cyclobacteriaceae bacterium]|nr:hypothetical protein [Cyclobacteriaceae bacterium]MDH4295884.1 hypothetical protein [Cyclobacteriaceae bacterium]MDH5248393.1 hypothetical protein [Cyclobacteriaceae bacterium]